MSSTRSDHGRGVRLDLWTSSFCGACSAARAAVRQAQRLVPDLVVTERDVAAAPDDAAAARVDSTPTVVVTDADGTEVFRSAGVPRVDQVLRAVALAL